MNYLYLIGCLILGMIFYHFLKGFCGCRFVEGAENGGNGLEVDDVQSADDCFKKNNNYSGPNKSNLFDDNEETLTRNEKTDFANKIYRILKDVPLTDI